MGAIEASRAELRTRCAVAIPETPAGRLCSIYSTAIDKRRLRGSAEFWIDFRAACGDASQLAGILRAKAWDDELESQDAKQDK